MAAVIEISFHGKLVTMACVLIQIEKESEDLAKTSKQSLSRR